jgi:ABC-type branched-subunit amino acid transport system ATPase component
VGEGDVPPVLCAIEPTKRFGEITALDDLSFALRTGSVTAVLGPNGFTRAGTCWESCCSARATR